MPLLLPFHVLLVLCLLPVVLGTATPEPQMDPFVPAPAPRYVRLLVAPAGVAGNRMGKPMTLSSSATNFVCADKYPTGFSVRCAVRPKPSSVLFMVDGKFARVERVVPYFLAGDWRGNVRPWIPKSKMVTVECRPRGRNPVSAKIAIKC